MPVNTDPWIMRPFNTLFNVLFAIFICVLVLTSIALQKRSERTRQTVLVSACLVTIVLFLVYKYALSLDRDYNVLRASMGGFNWWGGAAASPLQHQHAPRAYRGAQEE